MTAEERIRQVFSSDLLEHQVARLALLRILHAAEKAESQLDGVEDWICNMLDNPVEGIHSGVLAENACTVATHLESLAQELRNGAASLLKIRTRWQSFDSLPKTEAGNAHVDRGQDCREDDPDNTAPF